MGFQATKKALNCNVLSNGIKIKPLKIDQNWINAIIELVIYYNHMFFITIFNRGFFRNNFKIMKMWFYKLYHLKKIFQLQGVLYHNVIDDCPFRLVI